MYEKDERCSDGIAFSRYGKTVLGIRPYALEDNSVAYACAFNACARRARDIRAVASRNLVTVNKAPRGVAIFRL